MKFCPQCGCDLITAIFDSSEKLACSKSCGYVLWDAPTPVVVVIVKINDQYVLARKRGCNEDQFSFISGFVDQGATPSQCAIL